MVLTRADILPSRVTFIAISVSFMMKPVGHKDVNYGIGFLNMLLNMPPQLSNNGKC